MKANERETVEQQKVAKQLVLSSVEAVADRIEHGLLGVGDPSSLLEDVLWHLDQITGRAYCRGSRLNVDPHLTYSKPDRWGDDDDY